VNITNGSGSLLERSAGSELRWLADAYEQTQRVRLQTGERIRALQQGRSASTGVGGPPQQEAAGQEEAVSAEVLLKQIRTGKASGPHPLLGWTYRRHWESEQELCRGMACCLEAHPVWPWLQQVKGVGPTLAAKLLARLDPLRADTPSAFWAYCGLATVPGEEYRCETCGYTVAYPVGWRVSGNHPQLGSTRRCSGGLERARTAEEGVRAAQPKPAKGERAAYDQYAKKVCYLIGTSFLKTRSTYAEQYLREKARLERERPGWPRARRHLAALRKMEKLFLAHLWLVWREALGLPTTEPYAQQVLELSGYVDPWGMVPSGEVAKPRHRAQRLASVGSAE